MWKVWCDFDPVIGEHECVCSSVTMRLCVCVCVCACYSKRNYNLEIHHSNIRLMLLNGEILDNNGFFSFFLFPLDKKPLVILFHLTQLKRLERGKTLGELTMGMIRQHWLILETNHWHKSFKMTHLGNLNSDSICLPVNQRYVKLSWWTKRCHLKWFYLFALFTA